MSPYPVHVRARPDTAPSRWLWLVKWLLLIPHFIVLAFLWVAFVALTLIAYVAVLVTGRYPGSIFHFNVGVLRWSWRVGYYGYQALGTDRYPPFTLGEVSDYPAGLSIAGPPRPPRWLPLLAWLFAVPHLIIIGALNGAATQEIHNGNNATTTVPVSVVAAAVLVCGVALLFTGRRLPGLHDLLVGIARWTFRTVAYVALLTDRYPPFRLDQDRDGPDDGPMPTMSAPPSAAPSPPASAAAPSAASGSVAGRVVALVAGVLVLFTSVGLIIGGSAVLVLDGARDDTGAVTGPTLSVASPTGAVTVEGIQAGDFWARSLSGNGDIRITATSPTGTELFLGIAPEADVDRWLAGTAHDELVDAYTPDSTRYDRADGELRAVPPPGDQDFWTTTASGSAGVVLDWAATDGSYAIVLANVDGSPGVAATATVATRIPGLAPLGWGLIGAGAVLAVVAFGLIWLGAAGLGRRHAVTTGSHTDPLGPGGATPEPPELTQRPTAAG
ncbi:DUF4389 domain-containing protein [Krasilnikovia sp. M28-CT-15]|uniref:DUF4389 domain-containing protein n=1 Tax=Krasilnikovia sp. M28-CT-15 TaxID=3373540 RepID=UPI003876CBBF